MNLKLKHILKVSFWAICMLAFLALLFRTEILRKKLDGNGVQIRFLDKNNMNFINEADISKILDRNGLTFMNLKIDSINLTLVENEIAKNPFIREVRAYHDLEGSVFLDLIQRVPVMRIMTEDYSFYLDENGKRMPFSKKYTSKVMIVQGEGLMDKTEELIYLYSKIQENALLKAQIVGIFVDQNNEYNLSVQFGDFKIILGELDRLDEKFLKLEQTFRKIMNNVGWDTYSTINLKFKDQVVCTKR